MKDALKFGQKRDASPSVDESEEEADDDEDEEFTSYKCVATSSESSEPNSEAKKYLADLAPSIECRKRELEGEDVEVVKRNKPSASLAALAAAANYRQQNCLSIIQVRQLDDVRIGGGHEKSIHT